MKRNFIFTIFAAFALSLAAQEQAVTNASSEAMASLVLAINQQPHSDKEYVSKEAAIKQAGETHNSNPQIINALLDNLTYKTKDPNGYWFDAMNAPKYSLMPAHDALKTIGEPVIPVLLEKLGKIDDEKMRAQYAFLLSEIAGKDRGIELLKQNISDLSDKKERLEKSLKLLQ